MYSVSRRANLSSSQGFLNQAQPRERATSYLPSSFIKEVAGRDICGIGQPVHETLEGNSKARILTLLLDVQEDALIEDPGSVLTTASNCSSRGRSCWGNISYRQGLELAK